MKRKLGLLAITVLFLFACAGANKQISKTETIVISYETIALLAFPSVNAYLSQREQNGSLSGQALMDANKKYNDARAKFIQAGDMLKLGIQSPASFNVVTYQAILRTVAILLADLSGGNVKGNELTLPQTRGGK